MTAAFGNQNPRSRRQETPSKASGRKANRCSPLPTTSDPFDDFAQTGRDIEAAFLARGMEDPYEAYNTAALHDLTDLDFAYPEHRRLFVALMVSAEVGVRRWSCDLFFAWNREEDFLFGSILDEVGKFWLGPEDPGSCDDLAWRIRDWSMKRRLASEAVQRLAEAYGREHAESIIAQVIGDDAKPRTNTLHLVQALRGRRPARRKGRQFAIRPLTERTVAHG